MLYHFLQDSYVAVTGLPTPQSNHALIMAKFARECRDKLQAVTQELVSELGEDTQNLAVRVGLHSGPVTAGVLRGDKSRFQVSFQV
jgi:class 3 adenylate cyclase